MVKKKRSSIGRKKGQYKAHVEPSETGTTSLESRILNKLKYGGNDIFKVITKGVETPPSGRKTPIAPGRKESHR